MVRFVVRGVFSSGVRSLEMPFVWAVPIIIIIIDRRSDDHAHTLDSRRARPCGLQQEGIS